MFISIMSGVIGEVTRQAPANAGKPPVAPPGRSRIAAGAPLRAAKARVLTSAPRTPALPGTYRVLADSFRRAAGFYS